MQLMDGLLGPHSLLTTTTWLKHRMLLVMVSLYVCDSRKAIPRFGS